MNNPFDTDRRFLVVERASEDELGTVELLDREAVFRRQAGLAACVLMDLRVAWEGFISLPAVQEKSEFGSSDVAKVAGIGDKAAHVWANEQILLPTVQAGGQGPGKGRERVYSLNDTFVAGVAGSLRRQGVPRNTLKLAADCLRRWLKSSKQRQRKVKRREARHEQST